MRPAGRPCHAPARSGARPAFWPGKRLPPARRITADLASGTVESTVVPPDCHPAPTARSPSTTKAPHDESHASRIPCRLALTAFVAALPAAAQGGPDTLAKIKAAKAINVAFSGDSPPYSFVDKGNAPGGYSIDLCKKVIAQIGRTVGVPDLKVNWLVGTVAERLQMVASGKADLECANTTATQTRMQTVDFSGLIFVESGGFLVTAGGTDPEASPTWRASAIGVLAGTTTETRLAPDPEGSPDQRQGRPS